MAEPHPTTGPVLVEVAERVATVTLHRPEARNALNREVVRLLPKVIGQLDDDDAVDVIILTGTDPAFSAGVDLKELAAGGAEAASSVVPPDERRPDERFGPFPDHRKPVIGAINGVAVTGGFELALACDFLVASERARFADTHARVGIMPSWGMTVLLPQAVGVRRARQMSTTGNFIDAATALAWGLVNHVVPHDELLPFTRALAADIASADQAAVQQLLRSYAAISGTTVAEGWEIEREVARVWARDHLDPAQLEARRQAVVARGRTQL